MAGGARKNVTPTALVAATRNCGAMFVNLVCLGMRTIECVTVLLAADTKVSIVKKAAKHFP